MGKDKRAVGLLRTAEAARAAGVSKQSLQYYLLVGLLEASVYTPSGQQLFDAKAVERIRFIRQLNESGYPLREIREIFLRGEKRKEGGIKKSGVRNQKTEGN